MRWSGSQPGAEGATRPDSPVRVRAGAWRRPPDRNHSVLPAWTGRRIREYLKMGDFFAELFDQFDPEEQRARYGRHFVRFADNAGRNKHPSTRFAIRPTLQRHVMYFLLVVLARERVPWQLPYYPFGASSSGFVLSGA